MSQEFTDSCGIFPGFFVFFQEQLRKQETSQTCSGIQRCQCKYRYSQSQKCINGSVNRRSLVREHSCDTSCKSCRRAAESTVCVFVKDHTNCDQSHDTKCRLDQHGTVCDGFCVLFIIQLFGRSTSCDQAVETGTCAAGNGDKKSRKQSTDGSCPSGKCRNIEGCTACKSTDKNPEKCKDHHSVKQEAGQIVTRLEKDPDRNQGSYCYVNSNEYDPLDTCHHETEIQSENNDCHDTDDTSDGCRQSTNAKAVCDVSVDNGKNNKQKRDHSSGLVSGRGSRNAESAFTHKCSCNNIDKGCDNKDQHQKGKNSKKPLGSASHGITDDLTYGFSLMTDGCKQGTEILKSSEKDSSDDTPEKYRYPSEYSGLDRSVDRACACDR